MGLAQFATEPLPDPEDFFDDELEDFDELDLEELDFDELDFEELADFEELVEDFFDDDELEELGLEDDEVALDDDELVCSESGVDSLSAEELEELVADALASLVCVALGSGLGVNVRPFCGVTLGLGSALGVADAEDCALGVAEAETAADGVGRSSERVGRSVSRAAEMSAGTAIWESSPPLRLAAMATPLASTAAATPGTRMRAPRVRKNPVRSYASSAKSS